MKRLSFGSLVAVVLAAVPWMKGPEAVLAVQYPAQDPNYAQQIFAGQLTTGPGMAWTPGGNLLTRNGSNIVEYNLTPNTVYQGTSLHGAIATHAVSGLSTTGFGMTNGLDGYVYTVTGSGLQRFNPSNWAAPAQSLPGSVGGAGYGVTTLPDGRIAYADGSGTSSVYVYDPVALTNTWIYTAPNGSLIDGMVAGPTGHLALAIQSQAAITIITNTGTVVNSFPTPHYPDGLAFSSGITSSTIYSNNNDGTISKYVLGPGFAGTPVITDIFTGSGAYGDLASVGPDCAFYVSQFENGSYHGATPGVGTNWDNVTTTSEASIVRIAALSRANGTIEEICGFYTPLEHVPEPASLGILAGGLALLAGRRRRVTGK